MNLENDAKKLVTKAEKQGGFTKGQLNRLKNITRKLSANSPAQKTNWWALGIGLLLGGLISFLIVFFLQ